MERPVREINRLGVVRGGAGRLTGLILMVLVDGRASVRNAAETFGLERELMEALGELDDAWRSCQAGEGSGRHHGRHREPQRSGGREPLRTTGPTATPLEVREA